MHYTQEFIDELCQCPKSIVVADYREMRLQRGNWRNNFKVESVDGEFQFTMFVRYNDVFNENFSVGLDYKPKDEKGTIPIIRYNGPHGGTKQWPHHARPHIHKTSAENVNEGKKTLPVIEETDKYGSWQEAVRYFAKSLNIKGLENYFTPPQSDLFDQSE